MSLGIIDRAAVSAGTVLERLANGTYTTSLVDITRPCRVNPKVAVDESLRNIEEIHTLMQVTNSIFSALYLLAFNAVGNINSIRTMRVLDQLNPDRDPMHSAAPIFYARESAEWDEHEGTVLSTAVEKIDADNTVKAIYEDQSMAVGKILNIEISPNANGISALDVIKDADDAATDNADEKPQKSITIPVLVLITPAFTDQQTLVHIMEEGSGDRSLKERYYMAKGGQIAWGKDFLLQQDLAAKYRRTLAKDKSGIYMEMKERRQKNRLAALMSNRMSLAEAANIIIISKETERMVNRAIRGKLSDPKARAKIFSETYTMIIMVVDTQFEEVTIYYQGINEPTVSRFNKLKTAEKGKGSDIGELMEAFLKSNVPAI